MKVITIDSNNFSVSASIGFALFSEDSQLEDVLQQADNLMYQTKENKL